MPLYMDRHEVPEDATPLDIAAVSPVREPAPTPVEDLVEENA